MLTRVLNLELTLNIGLSLGHVLNTWGGGNGVPNLTQSSKLTQGLGHVSTFGVGGNGYLQTFVGEQSCTPQLTLQIVSP
jgi:hypothetical protein